MVKNHLKRIAAPKIWNIERKESVFITRPSPGPHALQKAMPLSLVMRELIKVAKTAKEVKQVLCTKDVFVDKRRRTAPKYPVGVMDVIEFPQLEQQFRILLDRKGRLVAVKADVKEAAAKLSRIESKTKVKGSKTQLNLSDGRNILVDKDSYAVGDTLQVSLPDQKITDHIKLEKGVMVLLVGGKYSGTVAKIDEISKNKIIIKSKNHRFETLKKYAFAVGTDKPAFDSIKQLLN